MKKDCSKKIFSQERIIVYFSELQIKNLAYLGRINYLKAHRPLTTHAHSGSMEICYLARGKQTYVADGMEYHLNGGDIFISFPDEPHGSGSNPEDKSVLYYLILDIKSDPGSFLGYPEEDIHELLDGLRNIKKRIFKGDKGLKHILDKVIRIYCEEEYFRKIRIQHLMTEFLIRIVELEKADSHEISPEIAGIMDFIAGNIKQPLTIDYLARKVNMSSSGFKQKFKRETGIPPQEYILRRKIEYAQNVLMNSRISITDMAFELGFSSSQYFSTVFKRFTGMSPTGFRKPDSGGSSDRCGNSDG